MPARVPPGRTTVAGWVLGALLDCAEASAGIPALNAAAVIT